MPEKAEAAQFVVTSAGAKKVPAEPARDPSRARAMRPLQVARGGIPTSSARASAGRKGAAVAAAGGREDAFVCVGPLGPSRRCACVPGRNGRRRRRAAAPLRRGAGTSCTGAGGDRGPVGTVARRVGSRRTHLPRARLVASDCGDCAVKPLFTACVFRMNVMI